MMTEEELKIFNDFKNQIVAQYKLKEVHPYKDDYFELLDKDRRVRASLNPKGKSLLLAVNKLCNDIMASIF